MNNALKSEPLRVGEILDASFSMLPQAVNRHLVMPFIVIASISSSSSVALLYLAKKLPVSDDFSLESFSSVITLIGIQIIIGLSIWLINFYIEIMIALISADLWERKPFKLKAILKSITPSVFIRALFLNMNILINTLLYSFLLIIPGVVYMVNRIPAFYILIFEKCSISDALKRSKTLMCHNPNHPWYSSHSATMRISGILTIVMIFGLIVSLIDPAQQLSSTAAKNISFSAFIFSIASHFLLLITIAYRNIAMVGFYKDLKNRIEGYDILECIKSISADDIEQ